ncbi:ROK family protein [Flammeovirga yaeyamensis]|uniref:ROK family protein n=1 Tax=Flammeovirga yaeyamensis TaxID=367791 RepID=A0AAX1N2V0_9BACT|nr:ROK family protein [Flammeovirga yaeyamensis]MBB3700808.1 glucokinase [Flammeovirga yaeyamensis]NMF37837.1 ROK family protein [Flammeovirga yaeyamensis]QWG01801.1 ROK family protein [Flammeovirga yaeyamensis]
MSITDKKQIVLTLDAGGTNFVFSAMQGGKMIVDPYRLPSNGDNLEQSLQNILTGFNHVVEQLGDRKPEAISFAFPGPADYPNGIIGDLQNLPGYRGGVALGPMLEEKFGIPAFINNDGDLFAYGEAIGGLLPQINAKLKANGSEKEYKNVIGITLGTGLGGGVVSNNKLHIGDNSMGGEIWLMPSKVLDHVNAEEASCIRAIQRFYKEFSGVDNAELTPKDIFEIAKGEQEGDAASAKKAFDTLGENLGDVLCTLATTVDAIVVIGGGLSGASELFMPATLAEMKSKYKSGTDRLVMEVFDLTSEVETEKFVTNNQLEIKVPFTEKTVKYDASPKIGVGISALGTSEAISLGAYAFAVDQLEN